MRRVTWPGVMLTLLSAVVALLPGCGATGSTADEDLPTLTDIQSRLDRKPPPQPGSRVQQPLELRVRALELPLGADSDAAWAVVDETSVPALTRGAWRANGLRLGLLEQARLSEWVDQMPPVLGVRNSRTTVQDDLLLLRAGPRLNAPVPVELTLPPMAPQREVVRRGRLRLMARLTSDGAGRRIVELLPHHHWQQATLLPRDPLEKRLDGRLFEELAVQTVLPRGRMLVVGLYRPEPTRPLGWADDAAWRERLERLQAADDDRAEEPDGDGPSSDVAADGELTAPDVDQPVADEPQLAGDLPLPEPSLGRALLTGLRVRQPVQVVLVLTVEQPATELTAPVQMP